MDEPTEEISPFDVAHTVDHFDGSETLGYLKLQSSMRASPVVKSTGAREGPSGRSIDEWNGSRELYFSSMVLRRPVDGVTTREEPTDATPSAADLKPLYASLPQPFRALSCRDADGWERPPPRRGGADR